MIFDLKTYAVLGKLVTMPDSDGIIYEMALDETTHRLFIGCRNRQKMVAMSTESGKILSMEPIDAGVHAVLFHAKQSFASCRHGSLVVMGEKRSSFAAEQVVNTPASARTMGIDPNTHMIVCPLQSLKPGATSARP